MDEKFNPREPFSRQPQFHIKQFTVNFMVKDLEKGVGGWCTIADDSNEILMMRLLIESICKRVWKGSDYTCDYILILMLLNVRGGYMKSMGKRNDW